MPNIRQSPDSMKAHTGADAVRTDESTPSPKRVKSMAPLPDEPKDTDDANPNTSTQLQHVRRRVLDIGSDDDDDDDVDNEAGATSIGQLRATLGLSRSDDDDDVSIASLVSSGARNGRGDVPNKFAKNESVLANSWMDDMRKDVTCAVCLQLLTRPVALSSCGHSFCRV
jgi:hypothetical protein